jgi:hypothetical protein
MSTVQAEEWQGVELDLLAGSFTYIKSFSLQ